MEVNCSAIIINSYDLKERDRILIAYTDKIGKISIIAKGIKSLKSKNRESTMLMSFSDLKLREGKNFYKLITSDIIKSYRMTDYDNYDCAANICKLLNRLMPEDYVNEKIFILSRNFIVWTENMDPEHKFFVLGSYLLKLLYFLGHYPALKGCTCGKNHGDKLIFDFSESVMYCTECELPSYIKNNADLTPTLLKYVDYMLKWDYSYEKIEELDLSLCEQVYNILNQYIEWHFN